jgi:hypothetical protein
MIDRQISRASARRVPDPQITRCASGYLRPLWLLSALLYVGTSLSSSFRLWLRGWLRLSLPLSLRGPVCPKGDQSPPQRRLRAWCFADIPTAPPSQNIKAVTTALVTFAIFSASLALDACAIASALARQRLSITSATVIALVLASPPPQSIIGFALAAQRFAVNRSWGSA